MDPLVLLPGMMCDARLFGPQIAALSARMPIVTAPIAQSDSIDGIAAALLPVLPPRFALAGLSMGGIVAMELLRRAPERIGKLALLDTNPLAERAEVAAKRAPQIARVQTGALRHVMRDEMKPNYLAPGPGQAAVLELVMEMAETVGAEAFVRQSRALMGRRDQCDTLRACAVPTLILCGAHDRLCPVERHQMMADLIPGATFTVIDDAGHLPTIETPEVTTQALERWLKSTPF